ncbi:MAG: superoxide dismutase, Ni [Candidatus Aenigmarchaeota archaeon]|nr:superoxide dismutase, Ni [Candidatus Aenigmarchaeota archaeon]
MSFSHFVLELSEKISPARIAYAHCDIPCGIYDPHLAQMAAHTVIRTVNLINEAENDTHKIARLTAVKEHHAELCKQEIRILWGDYFKPEHVKDYPELHELVWKVMKVGSKARQEVNLQASEELLETVNKIAEIFWKTKGIDTLRMKSPYPTGKETVYPKLK